MKLEGQTIYLIYCGWDYEGGDIKAVVTTMDEAKALKEKYSDSEHYSYDEVRIDTWRIGEVTDRRWETK